MHSDECSYLDRLTGRRADAELHKSIPPAGDNGKAQEVTRWRLRAQGLADPEIAFLFGEKPPPKGIPQEVDLTSPA
jgi:hypothetical protein